jgi:hypothetical protein
MEMSTIQISKKGKNILKELAEDGESYEETIFRYVPKGTNDILKEIVPVFVAIRDSTTLTNFLDITWDMLKNAEIGAKFIPERISDDPIVMIEIAEVIFKNEEYIILKFTHTDYNIEGEITNEEDHLEYLKFY